MKLKTIAKCTALALTLCVSSLQAQDSITTKPRLTIGGYGEAVYTRNFYSDNMFRYSHAERYKDAKGHGRIDLPHVVINLGYDFGKGWSMGSEIEFEHGGSEVAVEIEAEETGEFVRQRLQHTRGSHCGTCRTDQQRPPTHRILHLLPPRRRVQHHALHLA